MALVRRLALGYPSRWGYAGMGKRDRSIPLRGYEAAFPRSKAAWRYNEAQWGGDTAGGYYLCRVSVPRPVDRREEKGVRRCEKRIISRRS